MQERGRAHYLVLGLLAAGALIVTLIVLRRGERPGSEVVRSSAGEARKRDEPLVELSPSQAPDQASGAVRPSEERRSVETVTPDLQGIVVTPDQERIAEAEVRLGGFTSEDVDWEGAWYGEDWGPLERSTSSVKSDADGRFAFESVPEAPHGFVVWATKPGFRAATVTLEANREAWPGSVQLELERAPVIEVVVLDASGEPATGARVEQFGTTPRAAVKDLGRVSVEQARRLLAHVEDTDTDGMARFGALPGQQIFVASREETRSAPWRGVPGERIVLKLAPTFELSGTVSMPSWEHLDYQGERRITIAAQERNLWRTLHTIRSVEDGPWGPVLLPTLDVDRYRVRLEGSPIIPVEEFIDPPAPGISRSIALITDLGTPVYFRVADERDEVIREAVVKVKWQETPDHWNFVERRCNEEGIINVWSVPPGSMMFEAHAEGYVSFYSGLESTATYDDGYAPIQLSRAGRLVGRCLQDGNPVRDFEVIVQKEFGAPPSSTIFHDREDGTFEVRSVPLGDFWVTASSPDSPGGFPVEAHCPSGGTVEIDLELPPGIVGRGQVVDEQTGEPISSASIQMFVPATPVPIARWGLPLPVNADGTFEHNGFVRGLNFVRALAPGYSNRVLQQPWEEDAPLEWGAIGLSRALSLRIELEREGKSLGVRVAGRSAQALETRSFGDDNLVVYESVNADVYAIRFDDDNDVSTTIELQIHPEEEWTLRERIDGPNHLTVEFLEADGSPGAQVGTMDVSYVSSQGLRHIRRLACGPETAEVHGIDASTVSVLVSDAQGAPVTASGGSFVDGRLHLVIHLERDPFDLRVVDVAGNTVSGVRVLVMDPQTPGSALQGTTDDRGEVQLMGVPRHDVQLHLQHSTRGSHYGLALDASSRAAELVLENSATLEAVFVDGKTPLEGVSLVITDDTKAHLTAEATSDSSGRARIEALAPDRYLVLAWRPDCWLVEAAVEATPDGLPTEIQMRRLVDVDIEVVAASGAFVVGIAIELTSVEFEVSVARWIAEKRVRCEGLTTDERGQVRLGGLPRGEYGWSIDLPDGEHRGSTLVVEPGRDRPLRIVLTE